MPIKKAKIICRALTPLMMDPMSAEQLEGIMMKNSKPVDRTRPFEEVAADKIYRDPLTGRIGLKVEMIIASIVEAGRGVKWNKVQLSTAGSTHLFEYISIENSFLTLANIPPDVAMPIATYKKPRKEWTDEERAKFEREHAYWEVDTRRGVGEATGVAVGITRPKFPEWAFVLVVKYDDSKFNKDVLQQLVTIAGSSCGLGSFRPQKKGQFGRFAIMEYSEVEVKQEKMPPIKLYDIAELQAAGE